MSPHRSAAAAVVAAAAIASPLQAVAAAPTYPSQGDAILIGNKTCTIGYNDRGRRVSYTAAHCGQDGQRVRLIDRADASRSRASNPMGTFHRGPWDGGFSNDWGWIEWDQGVQMGLNRYSGDNVLAKSDVGHKDKVCYHGETSHQGTGNVTCGTFFEWTEESFTFRPETNTKQGDSGGPVYVPGKGLVGVISMGPGYANNISGYATYGPFVAVGKPMGWGAALRPGSKIATSKADYAWSKAAGLATEYDVARGSAEKASADIGIENSSSDSKLSSDDPVGSSGLSVGEIIAIIIPIVTVLAPALFQLAQQFGLI